MRILILNATSYATVYGTDTCVRGVFDKFEYRYALNNGVKKHETRFSLRQIVTVIPTVSPLNCRRRDGTQSYLLHELPERTPTKKKKNLSSPVSPYADLRILRESNAFPYTYNGELYLSLLKPHARAVRRY